MSAERVAVCPGSFDPITRGHEDIIRRSFRMADRVIVAVAYSATQPKSGMFSVDERVEMIRDTFADEPRVQPMSFQGLLVHFAKAQGADLIVRGLRAVSDFEYEFQMALMNRRLWDGMETVFLAPDLEHSYLSSSLVRQIAQLGGDVSPFVPEHVLRRLLDRFPATPEEGTPARSPAVSGYDYQRRAADDLFAHLQAQLRQHPSVSDVDIVLRDPSEGGAVIFIEAKNVSSPTMRREIERLMADEMPADAPAELVLVPFPTLRALQRRAAST